MESFEWEHKYNVMVERYKDLLQQHDDLMDREHKLFDDFLKIKMSIAAEDIPDALSRMAAVKYRYREGFMQPEVAKKPEPVKQISNTIQRRYRFD
tara:strand:+ start:609 stop:893 length:285 start_codon:yes stop_codon:yes gene_type:complete